jgi:hypothetical protein
MASDAQAANNVPTIVLAIWNARAVTNPDPFSVPF